MAEIFSNFVFAFVTSMREVLEAALIIGIIVGYLTKVGRKDLRRDVVYGVVGAVLLSILLSVVMLLLFEGLPDWNELFEGVVMIAAATILTWMIVWMWHQSRHIKGDLEQKVEKSVSEKSRLGLVGLVFFAVLREGAEIVLLLYASYLSTAQEAGIVNSLTGVGLGFVTGLVVASALAYLLFKSSVQLNLKAFFNVTSVILLIFAAGLVAHGIHEIYEFLEVYSPTMASSFLFAEVWNVNNTPVSGLLDLLFGWSYDPTYPSRFEKSVVGQVLTGLFGWNDNPALLELVAYFGYFIALGLTYFYVKSKPVQEFSNLSAVE